MQFHRREVFAGRLAVSFDLVGAMTTSWSFVGEHPGLFDRFIRMKERKRL